MARQYKLARKMKKITLTAAARELGVTQPALSSWESERKAPSVEAVIRMSKFYGVTTDFLLGLSQEADPRKDWLAPIDPSLIPVLHETPVFSPTHGWAFVDAITSELHFANGETLPVSNLNELYIMAPVLMCPSVTNNPALAKSELQEYDEVWVEPISTDRLLQQELRGWYRVKKYYVENTIGQRFYFDFYGAKWLAFSLEEKEAQNEV